jgi:UPF0716 protein FxsA
MFLLVIGFFVAEIYVLWSAVSHYGFVNTFFALLASAVLGAGLARSQGRYIIAKMQTSLAKGEPPAAEVVQGILVFAGGLLFILPGFVSDFVGLLCVLPGTRHLLARHVRNRFAKQVGKGNFRVFTFGMGGPFPGAGPFGRPAPEPDSEPWTRDVTPKVIDVTPISSRTEEKPDESNGKD